MFWILKHTDIFILFLGKQPLEKKKPIENIKNCNVVVMSGGVGKRLLPFTEVLPKPLIPIKGKPVVDHIIDNFKLFGIKKFFSNVKF